MASGVSTLEGSILCSKVYITDQHITLPHGKDGKIDYSTLGNILTAKLLEENLYLSYVDKMYGDSDKASPLPDLEGWKFFCEDKRVQVFRKCYASFPLHAFAGKCVIDVPMQQIVKVIADIKNRYHYDPMLQEIRDTVILSPQDYIGYMRHEAKRCLFAAKRDFCFYERRAFKGGKYIQAVMSIDHPSCPLVEGVIRAKLHPGTGWLLEPYRGDPARTLATIICHVDLCGMPNLIVNRVLRREPIGLAYLKKYVMSLDSTSNTLPALNQMTLDPDASVSSSILDETTSLPSTSTPASPDLLMNKLKAGDDQFHSISWTSESQGTLDDSAKHNNTDQGAQEPRLQQQSRFAKPESFKKNSAQAGILVSDGSTISTSSTNCQNVLLTVSTGNNSSIVGSGIIKDTVGTVSSIGYQPSLDEHGTHINNSTLDSQLQSVEIP